MVFTKSFVDFNLINLVIGDLPSVVVWAVSLDADGATAEDVSQIFSCLGELEDVLKSDVILIEVCLDLLVVGVWLFLNLTSEALVGLDGVWCGFAWMYVRNCYLIHGYYRFTNTLRVSLLLVLLS